MGIIRKTFSIGLTGGLMGYRSKPEKIARNIKLAAKNQQQQTALLRRQNALIAEQSELIPRITKKATSCRRRSRLRLPSQTPLTAWTLRSLWGHRTLLFEIRWFPVAYFVMNWARLFHGRPHPHAPGAPGICQCRRRRRSEGCPLA